MTATLLSLYVDVIVALQQLICHFLSIFSLSHFFFFLLSLNLASQNRVIVVVTVAKEMVNEREKGGEGDGNGEQWGEREGKR